VAAEAIELFLDVHLVGEQHQLLLEALRVHLSAELRDAFRAEGRIIEVAEYEPKINVTPNAVALKDD
jgi:hypothetical protein